MFDFDDEYIRRIKWQYEYMEENKNVVHKAIIKVIRNGGNELILQEKFEDTIINILNRRVELSKQYGEKIYATSSYGAKMVSFEKYSVGCEIYKIA